jgi:hypothetical protein
MTKDWIAKFQPPAGSFSNNVTILTPILKRTGHTQSHKSVAEIFLSGIKAVGASTTHIYTKFQSYIKSYLHSQL